MTVPSRLVNATFGPVSLCCIFKDIYSNDVEVKVEVEKPLSDAGQ